MSPVLSSQTLKRLLDPRSVAVVGASEDQGKFGGRVFKSLLRHGYRGEVFPINPVRETLFGLKTFPSIAATPAPPDLVIMAIPQPKVKAEIEACAARGARLAVIITSKFSDAGDEGRALEHELVAIARGAGMRLIGPNCLGLISPSHKVALCSTPALDVPELIEAPIGLVSQSGALMGTLFDRAYGMGIGFSHCVSVGNQADLELADFVDFLIDDPATAVICTYVEGIKSPRAFVELARRARAVGKPWLMVKAGMSEAGSRAAYSHTASLAGDFAALRAVCEHENVVLMEDPLAMLVLAAAMVRYPGKRVTSAGIVTTSGGGGAIAIDRLQEAGITVARFAPATAARLAEHYPPDQAQNPIDLGTRSDEGATAIGVDSAAIMLADPNTDLGLMVITTAPDVPGTTRQLADGAAKTDKPMLNVMMPGRVAAPARAMLIERRLPFTDTIGEAMLVLDAWKRWSLYEEPSPAVRPPGCHAPSPVVAGECSERETKALLQSAGIPVNRGVLAGNVAEALAAAPAIGYPLVLKIDSPDIAHKSDVGGVALGIGDEAALRAAITAMAASVARHAPQARVRGFHLQSMESGELELLVGARRDAQFGPQVVIGAGGVLVELLKEIVVLPAPVSAAVARRAVERLAVAPLLAAYRGREALDVEAIVDVVVRMSWVAADLHDREFEIEMNPVIVRTRGRGVVAVDARARFGPPAAAG